MLDAHVHIDHFPQPYEVAWEAENARITTVAVTVLPSHFGYAHEHVCDMHYVKLAVGLHPLYAKHFDSERQLFKKYLLSTSYVGEVGLDFSQRGRDTKVQQLEGFSFVLGEVADSAKLLTLHSKMAEEAVLQELEKVSLGRVVFHWYTGPVGLITDIVARGGYFSVNAAMLRSAKGQQVVRCIPRDRLLTETDGPFTKMGGSPAMPIHIPIILNEMAVFFRDSASTLESEIDANWHRLLGSLEQAAPKKP